MFYGTQIMTEMPFALLMITAFWSLDAALAEWPKRSARQILVGVVLTSPFWCRTVGVILVPVALLVIRRAGRPVRWVAAGALVSVSPWIIWTLLGLVTRRGDQITSYYTDYLSWWSSLGLPLLARVVSWNAAQLISANVELGMEGCSDTLRELGMRPLFLPWCVATYLVMLLAGVSAWWPMGRQARQGHIILIIRQVAE